MKTLRIICFLIFLSSVSLGCNSEEVNLRDCLERYVDAGKWVKQRNTYFAPDGYDGGIIRYFSENIEKYNAFSSDPSFNVFKEIEFDGGSIRVFSFDLGDGQVRYVSLVGNASFFLQIGNRSENFGEELLGFCSR